MNTKVTVNWGALPPNQNLLINLLFKKQLQDSINLRPEEATEKLARVAKITGLSLREVVEVMQPIMEQLVREYFAAVDTTDEGPPYETEPASDDVDPDNQPPETPLGFGNN